MDSRSRASCRRLRWRDQRAPLIGGDTPHPKNRDKAGRRQSLLLRVVLALAFGTAPRAALPPTCTAKRHCPNAAIARKCASLARSPVVPVAPVRFPRSVHSRSAPLRRSLSTLLTAPCGPPRFARRRISPPLTYAPSTPYALTRCGRLRLAHARRYRLHVLPMVARFQKSRGLRDEHAQGSRKARQFSK